MRKASLQAKTVLIQCGGFLVTQGQLCFRACVHISCPINNFQLFAGQSWQSSSCRASLHDTAALPNLTISPKHLQSSSSTFISKNCLTHLQRRAYKLTGSCPPSEYQRLFSLCTLNPQDSCFRRPLSKEIMLFRMLTVLLRD